MNRYLVETTHTDEDCKHVVEQFIYHGFIYNYDWGCKGGVHCGWAIVEADSEAEALLSVPPILRSKARSVILVKFTPEMLQASHSEH